MDSLIFQIGGLKGPSLRNVSEKDPPWAKKICRSGASGGGARGEEEAAHSPPESVPNCCHLGKCFDPRYIDNLSERVEEMFEVRAEELRKILVELGLVSIATAVMHYYSRGRGTISDAWEKKKHRRKMKPPRLVNSWSRTHVLSELGRPASYTTKYFGCELGAQSKFDEKTGTLHVHGAHDTAKLTTLLENFIKKYVQCYGCGNPETENPPEQKKRSKDTKAMRRAEKEHRCWMLRCSFFKALMVRIGDIMPSKWVARAHGMVASK
ncbi:hypothetical protein M9H77_18080 [Catharanthus roseus]|uniref:Uncharacterized protein n=1 Tax=Catharanthus roseus TaxID=4058 RepID=A0ACC0B6M9_CATRO|nr:hypothetical protein M9H77_18080 [Catharanthus roseus]